MSFSKEFLVFLSHCRKLLLELTEVGVSKVFLLRDVNGLSFSILDFIIECVDLFGVESGCDEEVIFLLGELFGLFLGSIVQLGDTLFLKLIFSFEFLVLFSQYLELVLHVVLFNVLLVKHCVQLFELVFELTELDLCLVAYMLSLTDLLNETLPFDLNALDLFLQCHNVLIEHLDFSLMI